MPRGNQIIRQWHILKLLEVARRPLHVKEIYERIQAPCSTRTVYRDLQQLLEAGFPLVMEEGRWRFLTVGEGAWSIPLEPTQAMALYLSEDLLAPVKGSFLADPLAELRRRIMGMLTPMGRTFCEEFRKATVATLFGPVDYGHHTDQLAAIEDAIGREHRMEITYEAPHRDPTTRTVDPYCIWYASGRVYLVAWCHRADDIRTFAVQRISRARVLDEPFEPRPGFNPAAFTRRGFGVFHGPVHDIAIDFSHQVAHLVRERRFHHSQQVEDRDYGIRLYLHAAGLPEIAAWVAGFGPHARPVTPPELVDRVRRIHEGALRTLEDPTTLGQDTLRDRTEGESGR